MENCKQELEYLIKLKKGGKKNPNKMERDEYAAAWEQLVSEEGFSNAAELYLYDGFTYCGARPLKNYISRSADPIKALETFFGGRLYGENCASTTQVLFHLLTLLINEKVQNIELIMLLIRKIPSALRNKEGNFYNQADRPMKKYILDELHSEIMPDFSVMIDKGLKGGTIKSFVDSFDKILATMDYSRWSVKAQLNYSRIQKWIHSWFEDKNNDIPNDTPDKQEAPVGGELNKRVLNGKQLKDTHTTQQLDNHDQEEIIDKAEIESKVSKERKIEQELQMLRSKLNTITAERDNYLVSIERLQDTIDSLKNQNVRLSAQIVDQGKHIDELGTENCLIKKDLLTLQKTLEDTRRELEERSRLATALSKDRTKQTDEAFNRLASKLRVEYRDFMDAIDLPMDTDLGENMREQIKNIFNILIKTGIAIN